MRLTQKLLCLDFVLSYLTETAVRCFSLDLFIKTMGADRLGTYFAMAALLSVGLILLSIFLSKKISPLVRFLLVHSVLVGLAIVCLVSPSERIQAQVVFLAMMGFNMLTYFSNWSITGPFVTPFESKRVYPKIATSGQIGVFIGALLAMASLKGLTRDHYFLIWLIGESGIVVLGFFLLAQAGKEKKRAAIEPEKRENPEEVSLLSLLRRFKLVPQLTLWVFTWGILYTAVSTLAGGTFDRSGLNLTVLYGGLSLGTALVGSMTSSYVFPVMVRWFRLGTVLVIASLIAVLIGGPYLVFDFFAMAVVAYAVFELIDGSFSVLAISTEFGLYPAVHRDRIRLLGEILALSAGAASVGFIFALPKEIVPWVIGGFFCLLVSLGWVTRKGFRKELLQLLKSPEEEERENAIALFDTMEDAKGYRKMLDLLTEAGDVATKMNVLHTFASLGTMKPASAVLRLLEDSVEDPLRIAVLHYFGNTEVRQLDPFIKHQLFEHLKRIARSKASNILRASAVRLSVSHAPEAQTVPFILECLRDRDERVIANAIEGLNYVDTPGAAALLLPFLKNSVPRIQANAVVALWKYTEHREEAAKALHAMVHDGDLNEKTSGVWAAGEVQDSNQKNHLQKLFSSSPEVLPKELRRNIPIALLKLGDEKAASSIVEMILEVDEKQAINVSYLSLRLPPEILNEKIIAGICAKGEEASRKAYERYSCCGGFCREQLTLLSGKAEKRVL